MNEFDEYVTKANKRGEKMSKEKEYCCERFTKHVENNEFDYVTDINHRHTFADEVGWWTIDGEMGYEMYKMDYCPFCGRKFKDE